MSNAFALIDCNNFYASTERVFDPKLHKKPVVVLSNNEGCVIARSDEAKEIGVTMGAPLFKVKNLLAENRAEIFSSNYELYGDMSARVMDNLREFSPEIEIYSIDEAFLGFDTKHDNINEIGLMIREKIKKWTGIPVSVGIAETKTLAKLANRFAKKSDGILNLYRSPFIEDALAVTPVKDLWGIGRASVEKLENCGVKNAFQLREMDLRHARKMLTVVGARLILELRGVSCLPLELVPPPKKSITCSRSFGQAVENYEIVREAVAFFLTRAAEKLRKHDLAANAVTVFIGTDRFNPRPAYYSNSATHVSVYPSDINYELQQWAFACLDKIFRRNFSYRKAGVVLSGLVPADELTERMFDEKKWERFRFVMKAIDEVNRKFGRDTVRFGFQSNNSVWHGKSEWRSNRCTTRFKEIMTVY
ncbi:MAG: Y-family DNA polymerase [Pyrinomonadaceae bacterium]